MSEAFLIALRTIADTLLIEEPTEMQPYLVDWRKRHEGSALAVALPGSTKAVSEIVKLCADYCVPIYPQGGNTSVCGGSVPDMRGNGIVVNLRRMNRILSVNPQDNSLVVEAGCVLANVQEAARATNRLFPMSLGAEGSCQIGGNIATNAGGTAVVRYGNMRDLVLGIEAVLADGTIWNGLRTLRKNNSGYDLKNLFIGSEGTIGIVTAAALKLFPQPRHTVTALVAVASIEDAAQLATDVQNQFPGTVSAVELISESEFALVVTHIQGTANPLSNRAPWYVLVELAGAEAEDVMSDRFMSALEASVNTGAVADATIATSERQRQQLWHIRHHVTEANVKGGMGLTHDIAVPPAKIPVFVRRAEAALASAFSQAVPVVVGHLGDGNLHYIAMFSHADWSATVDKSGCASAVGRLLYDIAFDLGGTFSAEHGIGSIHLREMARYKLAVEVELMKRVKSLFDPAGIMNPGRVLPDSNIG
ncbi:FAD-binding oxidoreductase [Bradyrhizobium sp. CCGUVB1N3]|uniref:FAD-binding oxidoreductase n=1 Tax=Bradyrhizobium sp. CCGUVB1N3 TaxID=2949629 RepID=UPI0020B2FA7E|nr:FAD-binding oxidoreductase [Bradyrhizobium sp. CCGUVB1N3]MCP3469042.1 FAD-binding oxidoreductase [Bradyrhizobium sp. CCGUVB1N3]